MKYNKAKLCVLLLSCILMCSCNKLSSSTYEHEILLEVNGVSVEQVLEDASKFNYDGTSSDYISTIDSIIQPIYGFNLIEKDLDSDEVTIYTGNSKVFYLFTKDGYQEYEITCDDAISSGFLLRNITTGSDVHVESIPLNENEYITPDIDWDKYIITSANLLFTDFVTNVGNGDSSIQPYDNIDEQSYIGTPMSVIEDGIITDIVSEKLHNQNKLDVINERNHIQYYLNQKDIDSNDVSDSDSDSESSEYKYSTDITDDAVESIESTEAIEVIEEVEDSVEDKDTADADSIETPSTDEESTTEEDLNDDTLQEESTSGEDIQKEKVFVEVDIPEVTERTKFTTFTISTDELSKITTVSDSYTDSILCRLDQSAYDTSDELTDVIVGCIKGYADGKYEYVDDFATEDGTKITAYDVADVLEPIGTKHVPEDSKLPFNVVVYSDYKFDIHFPYKYYDFNDSTDDYIIKGMIDVDEEYIMLIDEGVEKDTSILYCYLEDYEYDLEQICKVAYNRAASAYNRSSERSDNGAFSYRMEDTSIAYGKDYLRSSMDLLYRIYHKEDCKFLHPKYKYVERYDVFTDSKGTSTNKYHSVPFESSGYEYTLLLCEDEVRGQYIEVRDANKKSKHGGLIATFTVMDHKTLPKLFDSISTYLANWETTDTPTKLQLGVDYDVEIF